MTLAQLAGALASRSRALSSLRWLYGSKEFPSAFPESIPGISRAHWENFCKTHCLAQAAVAQVVTSEDGTTKFAVNLSGAIVEAVAIPGPRRTTVCISSQAGCTRRCAFCATKDLGFVRNLTAAEIVAQFQIARTAGTTDRPASNVVFMGMGEPFDNLDNVLRAIEVLTQAPAPQLARRSIIVSTSGVLPGLRRFLKESDASLALSLNATTDAVRAQIMPQTRTWPIAALLDALRSDRQSRICFVEYVLLAGINDSDGDIERLGELLRGLAVRVNLIPYNAYPGSAFIPPNLSRTRAFQAGVASQGIRCLIRAPKGRAIAAACGQLGATSTAHRS